MGLRYLHGALVVFLLLAGCQSTVRMPPESASQPRPTAILSAERASLQDYYLLASPHVGIERIDGRTPPRHTTVGGSYEIEEGEHLLRIRLLGLGSVAVNSSSYMERVRLEAGKSYALSARRAGSGHELLFREKGASNGADRVLWVRPLTVRANFTEHAPEDAAFLAKVDFDASKGHNVRVVAIDGWLLSLDMTPEVRVAPGRHRLELLHTRGSRTARGTAELVMEAGRHYTPGPFQEARDTPWESDAILMLLPLVL